MEIIKDSQFGEIQVSKNFKSRNFSIRVTPKGQLKINCPFYARNSMIKIFISSNRKAISELYNKYSRSKIYNEGDLIGKHHKIKVEKADKLSAILRNNFLVVKLPNDLNITDHQVQILIKEFIIKALRKQAKAYLLHRINFLAEKYDFKFKKLRFSHASTRWGSCTSTGTVSLNISLMNLDHELIDYVIIHELCHTRHMNHSKNFWLEVESILPNYKILVRKLKTYSPYI